MQSDGVTTRKHLESIWRQTGVMPAQLESAECPVEVQYIWGWFVRLSRKRTSNGFGVNPLTPADLLAWSTLRGINLIPFEIDAIEALDDVYMQHQNTRVKKND